YFCIRPPPLSTLFPYTTLFRSFSWLSAFRLTFFCRIPKTRNDFVSRLLPAAALLAEHPAVACLRRDDTFLPDASYVRRPDQHCSHNCRSTTSPCRRWRPPCHHYGRFAGDRSR